MRNLTRAAHSFQSGALRSFEMAKIERKGIGRGLGLIEVVELGAEVTVDRH